MNVSMQTIGVNNSNNLNFKNIYRLKVTPSLLPHANTQLESAEMFRSDLLKTTQQNLINMVDNAKGNLFKKFAISNKTEKPSSTCVWESFTFQTFKILKENLKSTIQNLSKHLGIEEPEPFNQLNHTFIVYTGKEDAAIKRAVSPEGIQLIDAINLKMLEKKLENGEIQKEDLPLWRELSFGVRMDEGCKKLAENKKIEDVTINTMEDYLDFIHKVQNEVS